MSMQPIKLIVLYVCRIMCLGLHYDGTGNQAYCYICLKAMNQVAMCLGILFDTASNQGYCFICMKAMKTSE